MADRESLARRAVVCAGWQWMPGMMVEGYRVLSVEGNQVTTSELCMRRCGNEIETVHNQGTWGGMWLWWPDFSDPATIGCLLALVREQWEIPTLAPVCKEGVWMLWAGGLPDALYRLRAATEVELLVAALEVSDG